MSCVLRACREDAELRDELEWDKLDLTEALDNCFTAAAAAAAGSAGTAAPRLALDELVAAVVDPEQARGAVGH